MRKSAGRYCRREDKAGRLSFWDDVIFRKLEFGKKDAAGCVAQITPNAHN